MIFISYRRRDDASFAGRLADRLRDSFGVSNVFLDVQSIEVGEDFPKRIKRDLCKSIIMIVVIGQDWIEHFKRKSKTDFVFHEIATALENNCCIIPVLTASNTGLDKDLLDDKIKAIADLEYLPMDSLHRFDADIHKLFRRIESEIFHRDLLLGIKILFSRLLNHNRYWLLFFAILVLLGSVFKQTIVRFISSPEDIRMCLIDQDRAFAVKDSDQKPDIARIVNNRHELENTTDLAKTIADTNSSFDIFVVTGSGFLAQGSSIKQAVRNGAKIRVLAAEMLAEFNPHSWQMQDNAGTFEIRQMEGSAKAECINGICYPKEKIFKNGFWVRDYRVAGRSLGHIEISTYISTDSNPCIRFGIYGEKVIETLHNDFENLWNKNGNVTIFSLLESEKR
jgi:hypothetical protein